MTTQFFDTYPHALDLNALALVYEQRHYDSSLEGGEFHSEKTNVEEPADAPLYLGGLAVGYMGAQHESVLPPTEVTK